MEKNLRICKVCREIKTRIEAGRYPNKKDKIYVDENGKAWSGSACSQCHVNRAREYQRQKAALKKSEKKV